MGGRLHLHVTALAVLARQPRRLSDGGVGVLAAGGARAVAAHGAFDVIGGTCRTKKRAEMRRFLIHPPAEKKMQIDTEAGNAE